MLSPHSLMLPAPRPQPNADPSLRSALRSVLSVESAFVSKFLPYREMTRIPPGYQDFVQRHFRQLRDDAIAWRDAAPAYALACLSHAAYGTVLDPSVEWELELQWADLKGLSRLSWPNARRLIMDAWIFLSGNEQLPPGLDHEIDARSAADMALAAAMHDESSRLPQEQDDDSGVDMDTELVPAYVVLRESMASLPPRQWKTRGQDRWLSGNVPALCLALSPALAVLEALTQQGFLVEEKRFLLRLAFPPSAMRVLEPAGDGIGDRGVRDEATRAGDRWALERRSPLLRVPSAICPGENNVLANLLHPDFELLQRIDACPMNLDRRHRSN